jgi:hypothetical protein
MAIDPGESSGVIPRDTDEKRRLLKRYQLIWKPSFISGSSSSYVIGENLRYGVVGPKFNSDLRNRNLSVEDLINLGITNELILPINTNIALGQEYSPSIKNKTVTYETVGGNSITTFGEAIRNIGMRIRIIRLSNEWELYYKALEALTYLSGNQARYYGSVYLNGYDFFDDIKNFTLSNRYKVTISSLDFNFTSDSNTTVTADLKMFVNQDLSRTRSRWGQI